jgi:hypothetical protein
MPPLRTCCDYHLRLVQVGAPAQRRLHAPYPDVQHLVYLLLVPLMVSDANSLPASCTPITWALDAHRVL